MNILNGIWESFTYLIGYLFSSLGSGISGIIAFTVISVLFFMLINAFKGKLTSAIQNSTTLNKRLSRMLDIIEDQPLLNTGIKITALISVYGLFILILSMSR